MLANCSRRYTPLPIFSARFYPSIKQLTALSSADFTHPHLSRRNRLSRNYCFNCPGTTCKYCTKIYLKIKLLYGQTINMDLYCQLLNRMKEVVAQKRVALANWRGTSIMFHYKNVRPHNSTVTRQQLRELNWKVLIQLVVRTWNQVVTNCSCILRILLDPTCSGFSKTIFILEMCLH